MWWMPCACDRGAAGDDSAHFGVVEAERTDFRIGAPGGIVDDGDIVAMGSSQITIPGTMLRRTIPILDVAVFTSFMHVLTT